MKKLGLSADMAMVTRFVKFREKYVHKKQVHAAEILEMTQPSLWRYENGSSKIPSKLIKILRDRYRLNPDWLMTGTGPETLEQKPRNTITDIAALRDELENLAHQTHVLTVNINRAFMIIEQQQKEIEELKAEKK